MSEPVEEVGLETLFKDALAVLKDSRKIYHTKFLQDRANGGGKWPVWEAHIKRVDRLIKAVKNAQVLYKLDTEAASKTRQASRL